MTKSVLPALAAAILALAIPGTARASLSLGPPQSASVTKTALAPALRTARFTRLRAERPPTPRPRRRIVRYWGDC